MSKVAVAVDLGTYTIKAIQANPGNQVAVLRTAEVFNPSGLAIPTDEIQADKLGDLINNIFNDHGLERTDVRLALPESLVSTKIISIPTLTDAELASAINWQAEQHIPIPLDELSLEYQVLSRPANRHSEEQMRVLMVGARKSIVDRYLDVFLRAGIEPTTLETQTLAVYRSLQFTPEDITTLVVHMGATNTDMVIVHKGEPRFVYTHTNAGQFLTRAIEQAIQLDTKQAEEYKRSYGLEPQYLDGRLKEVLSPAIRLSLLEMQKAMQFFASQSDVEPVKRILLSGGSAQLPGLVQVVTEQLGVEVLIAAPFASSHGEIPAANHPAYSVCMGVLMREE